MRTVYLCRTQKKITVASLSPSLSPLANRTFFVAFCCFCFSFSDLARVERSPTFLHHVPASHEASPPAHPDLLRDEGVLPPLLGRSAGGGDGGRCMRGGVEEAGSQHRPAENPSLLHASRAFRSVFDPDQAYGPFRPPMCLGVVLKGGGHGHSARLGVLPGHVPTIVELKPGLMSVHDGNDVTKYIVSSGFAFIHANSYADIFAVEAVPIDRIDASLVQKGLAEFTQKLNSASTDLEKAEAQIGVDVHSALNFSLIG